MGKQSMHTDGYKPETVDDADDWRLLLNVVAEGEVSGSAELGRYRRVEISGQADGRRDYYLLDALCRYLNTGGTREGLSRLCEKFSSSLDSLPICELSPSIQYWYTNEPEAFEHIYRLPGERCLRVVEDDFSEEISIQDALELIERDE